MRLLKPLMDSKEILQWVEKELSENRTDTIHDILAFLAEQMIEFNKTKNEEMKGFLKWLEREIGAEIDALTNKTAIKEYHEHNFEHPYMKHNLSFPYSLHNPNLLLRQSI